MMYIKARVPIGDGSLTAWELLEVESNLLYLGPHESIAVPPGVDHDYNADDRFPQTDNRKVRYTRDAVTDGPGPHGRATHFVRWLSWDADGATWSLVTDGPVFILNERGDTIEHLR